MKKSNILSADFQNQLKKAKQYSRDTSNVLDPYEKVKDLDKSLEEAFEGEGDA